MKVIEEVRRLRLAELKQEAGTYPALNALLGLDARDSTLSQCANTSTNSRTGKPKAMGSDLARRLEAVMNKPLGWMDTDPALEQVWPLERVDQARYERLSEPDKAYAQGAMNHAIEECEARSASTLTTDGAAPSAVLHQPRKRYGT